MHINLLLSIKKHDCIALNETKWCRSLMELDDGALCRIEQGMEGKRDDQSNYFYIFVKEHTTPTAIAWAHLLSPNKWMSSKIRTYIHRQYEQLASIIVRTSKSFFSVQNKNTRSWNCLAIIYYLPLFYSNYVLGRNWINDIPVGT